MKDQNTIKNPGIVLMFVIQAVFDRIRSPFGFLFFVALTVNYLKLHLHEVNSTLHSRTVPAGCLLHP